MVHGKPVVFEQTPCQRHFVGGLDQTSAEFTHALLLISRHDIEGRCEELLTEVLRRREALRGLIVHCTVQVILYLFRLVGSLAI